MEPEAARLLISKNPRNAECLFPYLTGDDINSRSGQSPSRWVIQFDERSENQARSYPDLWVIVEERVLPDRADKDAQKYPRMVSEWWKFWNNRQELYDTTANLERVLARSRVSELHMLAFVPKGIVYSDATVVFAFDDYYHFAILQSNAHEAWVRRNASTMRTDIRYTPTDCFDTFPFPQEPSPEDRAWVERVGEEYHEHRRQVMLTRNLGLTKTYNLFHNSECRDQDIQRLRDLHAEMDRAILACYGWRDLDPGHAFHQNERGQTRFTISPEARRDILRRLLELNLKVASGEAGEAPIALRTPPGAKKGV